MATTTLHSRLATAVALAAVAFTAAAGALSGPQARAVWAAASKCPLRLPPQLPARQIVVPILMYHRVTVASRSAPAMTRRLTVHPAVFRRQMTWLKRHGYRSVTQEELFDALLCGRPLGR